MVIIALPSPLVSILVSVTSCIAELLLLKSFRNIISLREHALLHNGHELTLKAHVRRLRWAQLVPLISFITMEILFSLFSSPTALKSLRQEDCISLRLSVNKNASHSEFSDKAKRVFANCVQVSSQEASVRLGNLSLTTNTISCADSPVYRFRFAEEMVLSTKDGTHGCSRVGDVRMCTWVKREGSVLWMSEQDSNPLSLFNEEAKFTKTELMFDIEDSFLLAISKRMAALENIGSYFFRKNVLLDSVEDVCEFQYEAKQGTDVPTSIAILLLTMWCLSIANFVMSCFLRGKGLYDVSNAMEMLTKTVRADDDQVYPVPNPAISKCRGEQHRAMYVMRSKSGQ
eukprot:TRINITY_DN24056_c0_g1_i1.p1 TRINITY_DN24056_c0_g1~~TRINITY_DN24056_c0_g1_i1.p1  ORF type:complete len:343 (+),score=41.99 TRINITY_DN24056_c0_g1_i1:77-1105(+)